MKYFISHFVLCSIALAFVPLIHKNDLGANFFFAAVVVVVVVVFVVCV